MNPLHASRTLRDATSLLIGGLDRLGLDGGQPVVVAFSGGADSLALLALLGLLPMQRRLAVEAVHVDHALRPDSASDAKKAAAVAESIGAVCTVIRLDAPSPPSGGLEAIARRGRYEALARVAAGRPILTAHTADDQAETILHRLARGTGIRGLGGIRPRVRLFGGLVLRPLLEVDRRRLRAVVEELDLPVVEDPTNATRDFVRNRLRLDVLPALEAAVPGAAAGLARAARHARADERYLTGRARLARKRLAKGGGVDAAGLLRLPEALRTRVVRDLVEEAGGELPSAARVHELLRLARKGGELHLPGGLIGSIRRGILEVAPGPTGRKPRTASASGASDKERE